jgi:regulator of sirC expression with transglutaminase-like and TPR domain
VLNRVLFHEFGFRGARENFENPDNSFLHLVLDRREGLPITLCAIYILVARRIGFELDPIGTPGRFMVGCFAERHPFYIDCWAGGRIMELEQMEDKLGVLPDEESGATLLPVTVAETLTRACRNLSRHYNSMNDSAKERLFTSFVHEFEKVHQEASNA